MVWVDWEVFERGEDSTRVGRRSLETPSFLPSPFFPVVLDSSWGKDLGFLARCFEGGGGVLAFEVVKSGDSDFWLWRGRNKKGGHGASRAE